VTLGETVATLLEGLGWALLAVSGVGLGYLLRMAWVSGPEEGDDVW
jgi:hypothetical protein